MKDLSVRITLLALLLVPTSLAAAGAADARYRFQSARKPGDIDRVAVSLELGGELIERIDGKEGRAKLSAVCNLHYDEKTLTVPKTSGAPIRSARYYDKTDAVIKADEEGFKPQLRDPQRLIAVEVDEKTSTLFSPHGALSRDELDLINVSGNSLLLDGLLPDGPVTVGDSWKLPEKLLMPLLDFDRVDAADVRCTLVEVTVDVARFKLTGHVNGTTRGARTRIELKGKYRFSRKAKRIDWLGLLIKEKREIGEVVYGLDVVARLQVQIARLVHSPQLTETALRGIAAKPAAKLTQLAHESKNTQWRFTYDRCWYITTDRSELTVLRMLDRGEKLAQCNVSSLPKRPPDKLITLAEFQADVQRALGESFRRLVEAGQFANESDYRVYRVVARGEVEEVPIQWNYYLLADRHGRQVVFAFTIEQKLLHRFRAADEKLIRNLRFLEPQESK